MKDVVLFAVSVYLLKQDVMRVSVAARQRQISSWRRHRPPDQERHLFPRRRLKHGARRDLVLARHILVLQQHPRPAQAAALDLRLVWSTSNPSNLG